jgi:small subunit ribosomal protein S19
MAIKEFKWQGKTEEEIKLMDLKEFMAIIPARRRRSLKRGFTDAQKKLMVKIERGDKNIKTHCRNMIILPQMLGMTLRVYNGKDYVMVIMVPEMLGHTLGEFSHSRKMVSHSSAGVGATRSSKAVSAR